MANKAHKVYTLLQKESE